MKINKILFSILIVTIVITGLAFKKRGFGVIYCGRNFVGSCTNLIDYTPSSNSSDPVDPCGGGITQEYAIVNGVCTAISPSQNYTPTLP
jgi:hypothetical protein